MKGDQTRWGGGVLCYEAGARLVANHIIRNHVAFSGWSKGGGVCVASYRSSSLLPMALIGNCITDNKVSGGTKEIWPQGGGIYILNVNARVEGNLFARDSVSSVGGAAGGALSIISSPSRSTAIIKDNDFIDNVVYGLASSAAGGAVDLFWTDEILIENNDFIGNKAICGSGSGSGGAIDISDEDITDYGKKLILNNRIIGNSIFSEGNASGGGISLYKTLATISGNEIMTNSAGSNHPDNIPSGAGIYTYESRFTIENNIISGNKALGGMGGGIYINRPKPGVSAAQSLLNNTIYANQATSRGGGVAVRYGAKVNMMNNIIFNNRASMDEQLFRESGSVAYVNYNNIEDGYEGEGNIDEDPQFVGENDFHLTEDSPCIGTGIDSLEIDSIWYVAPALDIEGNPRPNPQDTLPDMGAFESPFPTPDAIKDGHGSVLPLVFTLDQNYPNPFNPRTVISYALPVTCHLDLSIYNILGQKVATLINKKQPAGSYQIEWDASGVSSGVYYYRLEAEGYSDVKKMVVIK
jgi:hypothetical protein